MSESVTPLEIKKTLEKRIQVKYDDEQLKLLEVEKNIVLLQIERKELNKESFIHNNQEKCSLEILSALKDKKICNIMVVALTQSGKTGTMCGVIKNYLMDPDNFIPIENIYIITGLSSCNWVNQTTSRMPESIKERVFHRDNIKDKFVNDIKDKKNVLIIIDEVQIAAKENQTLYHAFSQAGIYNPDSVNKLLERDIKIIEFSATPDGTIYDLMTWGDHALKIKMNPGESYTSCFDFKNEGRVFQYQDLCGYNTRTKIIDKALVSINFTNLQKYIDDYNEPLYHIIRTPNGMNGDRLIDNFETYISEPFHIYRYNKDSEITDINNILKKKPLMHTFIFIKEKLRCAITLNKTYLGIMYERYTKSRDDAVIIQGLIGRGTGYDNNGKSIFFTNIESIEKYEKLWNSNFDDTSVPWNSKTTTRKTKILKSKGTYNNPKFFANGLLSGETIKDREPISKYFNTQEEAMTFYKKELQQKLGGVGPKKREPNNDGFYEATIGRKRGTSVYSTSEIHEVRKWALNKDHKYTFHPCYEDTNDKSTLKFCLSYYL